MIKIDSLLPKELVTFNRLSSAIENLNAPIDKAALKYNNKLMASLRCFELMREQQELMRRIVEQPQKELLKYLELTKLPNLGFIHELNKYSLSTILKSPIFSAFSKLETVSHFEDKLNISDSFSVQIEDDENAQIIQIAEDCLNGKPLDKSLPLNIRQTVVTLIVIIEKLWLILSIIAACNNISINELIHLETVEEKQFAALCNNIPEISLMPAEIREVSVTTGELQLRQYDRKSAKVLMTLDNGTRFCVLTPPKGNHPWLRVAVKNHNGETITGYVMRKHTKKIYF